MITGRHRRITRPLQYLALGGFMIFLAFPVAFPVVYLLVTALKPQSELLAPEPSFLPKELEWSNFAEAIDKTRFWTTARNSAVVATVRCSDDRAGHAGGLRPRPLPHQAARPVATGWILLSQVFPFILIIIPLFIVLRDLASIDTLVGLVAVYTVWSLPFALWMLRGYIAGIPADLEEAGAMDGASRLPCCARSSSRCWRQCSRCSRRGSSPPPVHVHLVVERVLLRPRADPVARARDPAAHARQLRRAEGQVPLGQLAAASLLATIPSLVFFAIIQRRLTSGLLSGAVKG